MSRRNSRNDAAPCGSDHLNGKSTLDGYKKVDEKSYNMTPVRGAKGNGGLPSSTCATPAARTRLGYDVSPICMGDEYQKQSCRKNLSVLSLTRETDFPHPGSPEMYGGMRESRKRKDITTVRVLFSQHLDEDVVKQQKKVILLFLHFLSFVKLNMPSRSALALLFSTDIGSARWCSCILYARCHTFCSG